MGMFLSVGTPLSPWHEEQTAAFSSIVSAWAVAAANVPKRRDHAYPHPETPNYHVEPCLALIPET